MANLSLDNPHDLDNRPSVFPKWAQWGGVVALFVGLIVATAYALTEHWRRATFVLGASMLWVAVLRITCDSKVIGLIAVRSRRFDVLFSSLLGAAMIWMSVSIDSLGS
ncbi:DUF3017 domain-containing protein [Corynebacterium breve]|uniref:DUF3017 domain-containing protein n=1 Tax=Corynebacterium breve TaxID=3049799 RepID=A0ABY8VEW5_9CORY|nr:DUF3017 domain-containing protein [Corynebacterium breve]WIM68190.1 DUF3017 domain-containing protein [Corynebacterium breve]